MHIESLVHGKKSYFFSHKLNLNRFWIYIFQLESIRALQFEKLLLSQDSKSLLVKQFIANVKLHKITHYHKYLFSFFIFKMQVILHHSINNFPMAISSSIFSVDLYLDQIFLEYKKRLYFFYNNFYFNKKFFFQNVFFKSFGLNFQVNNFVLDSSFLLKKNFLFFEVFLSVKYCINKLVELGIFHKLKFRSIGNSKLINLEDDFIIKQFSLIAINFLNWFSCCRNFYVIKRLIFLIRESCFLTLCRKHNKHKSWVYNTYTRDLNIIYTFNFSFTFFPSNLKLRKLKRKFYFFLYNFFVDESFFLN